MKGVLIAGTNSGCGKTTFTIGLMALLKSLGYKVAPFKTGPDYIDPMFHSTVLNTPSYNLDSHLLSKNTIKYLFNKHCSDKDIAIIEGVMGMYDGMGLQCEGSSYELSQILDIPVILVVNCKGLYQSVAAIIKGYSTLKSNANIKGVILNQISNESQFQFLKSIIEKECEINCLGYLPNNKCFALNSRHLGLIQAEEVDHLPLLTKQLVKTLSQTVDLEKLLQICEITPPTPSNINIPKWDLSDLHIGVAHDKAFRFYYQDNLELLSELGAKLSFFSPIDSHQVPIGCNALYIGGGYPEVFAKELSNNVSLLNNIKKLAAQGLPIYAECGGLIYLCNEVIQTTGDKSCMAGIFNASIQMTERLQRFGYANIRYKEVKGKCHEFHRSNLIDSKNSRNYSLNYKLQKPDKEIKWQCGLQYKNCLAGYAHIHFYSNFQFLEQIIKLWRKQTT